VKKDKFPCLVSQGSAEALIRI